MAHHWFSLISQYSRVVGFMIGLPVMAGTYYESLKARQGARRARERLHSLNCLEFIAGDGTCIDLVPLETLHSLPRVGGRHSAAGRRGGWGVLDRRVSRRKGGALLYARGIPGMPAAGGAADEGGGAGDEFESGSGGLRTERRGGGVGVCDRLAAMSAPASPCDF